MSNAASRVLGSVSATLQEATAKELWTAIKSELIRPDGGPDAVEEYLNTEASRIKQIVEQATAKV